MKSPTKFSAIFLSITVATFFIIGVGAVGYYFCFAHANDLKLSEAPKDWGSFGSYVSGVFAPLSSLAVIIAIYIFESQYSQQLEMFNEQKSMELYKDHKDGFERGLNSIEEKYQKHIKINAKIDLYYSVFPDNSAFNFNKELVIKPIEESKNGDIEYVFYTYKELCSMLSATTIKNNDIPDIIIKIYQLNHFLGIELRENNNVGEVVLSGINPNFNILLIEESLGAIYSIIKFISSYAKSDIGIKHINNTVWFKRKFLKVINTNQSYIFGYHMVEDTNIRKVRKIYNLSEEHQDKLKSAYIASSTYLFNYSVRNKREEDRILEIIRKSYHDSKNHEIRKSISSRVY